MTIQMIKISSVAQAVFRPGFKPVIRPDDSTGISGAILTGYGFDSTLPSSTAQVAALPACAV